MLFGSVWRGPFMIPIQLIASFTNSEALPAYMSLGFSSGSKTFLRLLLSLFGSV